MTGFRVEEKMMQDQEFWKEREELMKRFKESREKKKAYVAEMESMLRKSFMERTGQEPTIYNVW